MAPANRSTRIESGDGLVRTPHRAPFLNGVMGGGGSSAGPLDRALSILHLAFSPRAIDHASFRIQLQDFKQVMGSLSLVEFETVIPEVVRFLKDDDDHIQWKGVALANHLLDSPHMDGRRLDILKLLMRLDGATLVNLSFDARRVWRAHLPRIAPFEFRQFQADIEDDFGRALSKGVWIGLLLAMVELPQIPDRSPVLARLWSLLEEGSQAAFEGLRVAVARMGPQDAARFTADLGIRLGQGGDDPRIHYAILTLQKEATAGGQTLKKGGTRGGRGAGKGPDLKRLTNFLRRSQSVSEPFWRGAGEWEKVVSRVDPAGNYLPRRLSPRLGSGGEWAVYPGRPGEVIKIAHRYTPDSPKMAFALQEVLEQFGVPYLRLFDDPAAIELARNGIVVQPLAGPGAINYHTVRSNILLELERDEEHETSEEILQGIERKLGPAARRELEQIWDSLRQIHRDPDLFRQIKDLGLVRYPKHQVNRIVDVGEVVDNLLYDPFNGWYFIDW